MWPCILLSSSHLTPSAAQAKAGANALTDDNAIGHSVPAGSGPAGDTAAGAATDDNAIDHTVPAGSGPAGDTAAAAAATDDNAIGHTVPAGSGPAGVTAAAAAATNDNAIGHSVPAGSGPAGNAAAAAATNDNAIGHSVPAGSGPAGDTAAAAATDDNVSGHTVPAGSGPTGDTTAAAAATDDNAIGHAVPAGKGPAGDTAAATWHQSPEACWGPKRMGGAARDAVTAAAAALVQARSAYWGLGCFVGAPLHVAGAVKYLLPPMCKPVRHIPWLLQSALPDGVTATFATTSAHLIVHFVTKGLCPEGLPRDLAVITSSPTLRG